MMTPGFTPMILSNAATTAEANYLDNCFMHDNLGDFVSEDFFLWQSPLAGKDSSSRSEKEIFDATGSRFFQSDICIPPTEGEIARDYQGQTPKQYRLSQRRRKQEKQKVQFLVDQSEASFEIKTEEMSSETDARIATTDDTLMGSLSLLHTAATQSSSSQTPTIKSFGVNANGGCKDIHSTIAEQPLPYSLGSEYHNRSPDSLVMICTELYSKILSEESGDGEGGSEYGSKIDVSLTPGANTFCNHDVKPSYSTDKLHQQHAKPMIEWGTAHSQEGSKARKSAKFHAVISTKNSCDGTGINTRSRNQRKENKFILNSNADTDSSSSTSIVEGQAKNNTTTDFDDSIFDKYDANDSIGNFDFRK